MATARLNDEKIKLVVIKSYGQILMLGGLQGPILKPFPIQIKILRDLIVTKKEVYEALKDGTLLKLTLENYNTENGGVTKLHEFVPKKTEESQTDTSKEKDNKTSVSTDSQSKPQSTGTEKKSS